MGLETTIRSLSTALTGSGPTIVTTINTGFPGPAGPAGPPGSGGSFVATVKTATETLSGHRAVYADSLDGVSYASASIQAQASKLIGVTSSAAIAGDDVQVTQFGEMVEGSWSWTPGPVYLGENGALTQTAPTTGNLVVVGTASAPTNLFVKISELIKL